MKRVAFAVVLAVALAGTRLILGQGQGIDNPFLGHSDTGETVHVLPPPAALHSPRDTQPTVAKPHDGYAVYSPSYGSGNLLNHGGHQIADAGFLAIYWNSALASSLSPQIDGFVTSFSGSMQYSTTDVMADYSIIQQYGSADPISFMLRNAGAYVDVQHDGQRVPATYNDSKVRSYLASLFDSSQVVPDENTVYGIYFPPGMKISLQGGTSCSSFCGYHGHFTYLGFDIKYASFPYTDCRACSLPGLAIIDMLTIVSSHEIREAVTDPGLNAWYDSVGYEADDKCAWHNLYQMARGSYWVQPEFSNGSLSLGFPGPGCVVPNR